jgi:5-dehydro-4-deoxyglucarate dehydratase
MTSTWGDELRVSPDTGTTAAAAVAQRLKDGMANGVLSFPLTSFHDDGSLDEKGFRAYLADQIATAPGAVFPACGTGEFFSLDEDEQGVGAQLEHIAARTRLPLITYQRGQVAYTAGTLARVAALPNVIGLKDGHSDLDRLQRLTLAAPDGFLFFNGAATAEIQARAYATVGVPAYSSAVHAFAPEIANAFFAALRADDRDTLDALLRGFYVPLVELRDRVPGYAVSLVKAAARLRGRPVGPVRAPLTDPSDQDLTALKDLLTTGLDLVGAAS